MAATAARSRRQRRPSRPATSFDPDISSWDAWRPERVASLLEEVDAPWYVAAGWAIDLFLGGEHREHEDLEIAVPNSRFDESQNIENSETFVLPSRIAPAACRRRTGSHV